MRLENRHKGFMVVIAWHVVLIICLVFWAYIIQLATPLGAAPVVMALDISDIVALVVMAFVSILAATLVAGYDLSLIAGEKTLEEIGKRGY